MRRHDELRAYDAQPKLRDRIRRLLIDQGLKQKDLANVLGLKQAALSQRMTGNQWLTDSEVAATARYLSIEVDDLMAGSYYRHEAHQAWLDVEAAREAERAREAEESSRRRALCCECGALRLAAKSHRRGSVYENTQQWVDERGQGRMTTPLKCKHCQTTTRHALLRDNDEYANMAEEREPSVDETARVERDALVTRLVGFNIDVHFRPIGSPKYRQKQGRTPAVAIEYDESKSQWRVEINSDVWPSVQLPVLHRAWRVISTDDQEFWEDLVGPTNGAWMFPGDDTWDRAIDGLVDEIQDAAASVLLKTALEIADAEPAHDTQESS